VTFFPASESIFSVTKMKHQNHFIRVKYTPFSLMI